MIVQPPISILVYTGTARTDVITRTEVDTNSTICSCDYPRRKRSSGDEKTTDSKSSITACNSLSS